MNTTATQPLRAARSQAATIATNELSLSVRSLLAWSLPVAAMLSMTLSIQKSMSQRGSLFEAKLAMLPREMRAAFGIAQTNLADPVHYLATNFTFYSLIGALFAALIGAAIATREANQRVSEMLYTHPIERSTALAAKSAAGLAVVVGFDAILLATSALAYTAAGVSVGRATAFVSVFAGAALVHATVFSLSLLAGVSATRPRSASSLALGATFALYGCGVLARVSDKLSWLEHLSPFSYADAAAIATRGHLAPKSTALLAATFALLALAQVRFARRDIDA